MPLYRQGRGDLEIQRFLDTTQAILAQISTFLQQCDTQSTNLDDLENAVDRMTDICSTFDVLRQNVSGNSVTHNLLVDLTTCLDAIRRNLGMKLEGLHTESAYSFEYHCALSYSGEKGRPRLEVMKEQLEFLRNKHFRWVSIAKLLGISERTLRRRREEFGLRVDSRFTEISEEHLTIVIQAVRSVTPNIGQSRMIGALRSRGLHVQRWRIREIMRKIDPVGTALRWNQVVYRRKYSVPGPNALWHIDGHHKLIHWRLVVHACIDGYSRLIVYLHCANNNFASTVLDLFKGGVRRCGLPSRTRSDHGLENVEVARFMMEQRGLGRGSMLTGKSVHNVRVERLHRDVYIGALSHFASIFHNLENGGFLNPDNDAHIYALHFIFIPRINRALKEFTNQWNCHPVSTAQSYSPEQLFISGTLANGYVPSSDVGSVDLDLLGSGVDDESDAPPPIEQNNYEVTVPEVEILLPNEVLECLSNVDPLQDDGNHGVNLYSMCVQAILTSLSET